MGDQFQSGGPERAAPSSHVIMRPAKHLTAHPDKMTKEFDQLKAPRDRRGLIMALVWKWPNLDIWPLKFGTPSLSLLSAGTAFFLNKTFREALYLDYRLRVVSYLGLMAFSGISSGIWHYSLVTSSIIGTTSLEKDKQCPICLQVKAAGIQLLNGMGYPLLFAPIISYTIASSFKDRHLPKIYKRPKDVIGYTKSVYKPVKGVLGFLAASHLLLAMGVTYFEQECFYSTVLPIVEGKKIFANKPEEMS